MEAAELRQVTRNISNELGGVVSNIRKTANDNQKMFSSILKDIGNYFNANEIGLQEISSDITQSSNRTASKIDSTNILLQEQIGILSNVYGELRSLNGTVSSSMRNLGSDLADNNKSFTERLMGGLKGLQNVIIGSIASAAPGVVGFAGGMGAGFITDIMGGKSVGGAGQKISNPVMAKDIYSYLKEKGVDHEHAVGILANIQNESQFNSGAIGDGGTSGGLFQHHNERFTAMRRAAGPEWQKNWKGQVDYALSEEDMKTYLKRPVRSGEEAARAFVYDFERPADKPGEANKRAANVGNVEKLVGGAAPSAAQTRSSISSTTPSSTTATPVEKPAVTSVGHTSEEHTEHAHEGIITGKQSHAEQTSSTSAKEFLQSRGGAQSGAVGVNAEKLDGEFADRMAKAIQAAEQATGSKVTITEGYRDPHVQAQYYSDYIGKPITYDGKTYQPNPAKRGRLAAPPGKSKHQKGMAVDLADGPAREWLIQNASRFGIESLFTKIGQDKPHFQMPGHTGEEGAGPTIQEASPYQGTNISSVSPGTGSSVDQRMAQINENIQRLGGGVEGVTAEGPTETSYMGVGIPAGGGAPVDMYQYMQGIQSSFLQQMSGTEQAAPPPMSPSAFIVPDIETSRTTQAIEQSQIEDQIDNYAFKENLRAYTEQTKKQTTDIAASEATSGTPVSYDYNNSSDIGWPDWASMIGGNHWNELKKIKMNMWG